MDIKWLIYCRVSSKKQVKEWNWLSSQEKRCRDYATSTLWIWVEKVFNDEWVSWWIFERKSIQELFKYIDRNKQNSYIVIFEDLNRLSRDIQVHALLKSEFKKRWVELACPNFKFEESPEWDFKENISVIVSQYEKDKNKQRVLQRMKSRLEQWFWCFRIPIWYKFIEAENGWRIMIKDSEVSYIIKIWLEKYADWVLQNLSDLLKFFSNKWMKIKWIKDNWKIYTKSHVYRIATNILYAWYLECEKWDIPRLKAQHEWIISIKTFDRIQQRLIWMSQFDRDMENCNNRIDEEFPLRGFLYCEDSKYMLSSWWSKWTHAKFPYYTYPNWSPMRWKSINRDVLHKEFTELLKNLTPKKDVLTCFEKIFYDVLNERKNNFEKHEQKIQSQINEVNKKIDNYVERIWSTNNEILIENYELKIENLQSEKEFISEKLDKKNYHLKNLWTILNDKLKKVSNGLTVWNWHSLEKKKEFIKMVFPTWIPINKKKQLWTVTFSLIYQAFEVSKVSKNHLVELDGFEPTSREARIILLLSYFILIFV